MLDVPRTTDVTQSRETACCSAFVGGIPGCRRMTSRASTPIERFPITSDSRISIAASITSSGSSSEFDAGNFQRRLQGRQIVAGDAEMPDLAGLLQRRQGLAHGRT